MTKQAITIISGEETFCNLATFEDIKQLNDTVRTYKELYADSLSKTAVEVLNVLHRHSAKYTGVSFLTKNNIAKLVGKSRRTIIRICQALEDLGVIKQYEMKRRSDMRQTSSAIVIQPFLQNLQEQPISQNLTEQTTDVTQDHPEMSHHEDKIPLKQIHNINKRTDASFTSDSVDKGFKELAACFYDDSRTIEEYWKMIQISSRNHKWISNDKIHMLAIDSFKQMIGRVKRGGIRKNGYAYFYGILNRKLRKAFYEDTTSIIF